MLIVFQITFIISLLVLNVEFASGIAGGSSTTVVQHPYIVQLRGPNGKTYCAGTVVKPKYIVTAASCVYNTDYNKTIVVGGTGKINGNGVERRIANVTIHPDYNDTTLIPDLAVIELRRPMEGSYIKPMPLCDASLRSGDVLQVLGWGKMSANAKGMPIQLQTVRLTISKKQTCKDEFGPYVEKNMFCTTGAAGKGHCYGDSGGPAVYRNQLCGIAAFAYKCGAVGFQSAYTSIYPLLSFIKNVISAVKTDETDKTDDTV